jgi:hypothetical protein
MQRIEAEWLFYQSHFLISDESADATKHAFYMACLRMLQISQMSPPGDLKGIARELDRYLARDDGCICEACKIKRERGEEYSLADLFPEGKKPASKRTQNGVT